MLLVFLFVLQCCCLVAVGSLAASSGSIPKQHADATTQTSLFEDWSAEQVQTWLRNNDLSSISDKLVIAEM